jgi:hypothetical protein
MFSRCCCLGANRQVLKEPWSLLSHLLPVKAQGVFLEAERKLNTLNSIDLGGKRSLTVGESLLWAELCGLRFSAQVAAAVSLEATSKDFSKPAALAKDAAAIRYANITPPSIANYLRSSVYGKRPKPIHEGINAAAADAEVIAAKAIATVDLEETKRLAAKFEAFGGGALPAEEAEASAKAAAPGGPLREC